MPYRPAVTISLTGLAAATAPLLAPTARLPSQWADPLRKRRLSRIIDDNTRDPTYDQKQNNYEITDKYTRHHII